MFIVQRITGLALIVAGVLCAYLLMPARYTPDKLSFPAGTPPEKIVAAVGRDGLVHSPALLRLALTLTGRMKKVTPGTYAFSGGEDFAEVFRILSHGGLRETVRVTIPEGYTASQIAGILQDNGLLTSTGEFMDELNHPEHYASATPFLITSLQRDPPQSGPPLEGFLYPATYDFYVGAPPERLIEKMLRAFAHNLPTDTQARLKDLHRSLPEIVIIASLIEREALLDKDRPLISSVIYNRLKIGMPLQIDATLAFALNKWGQPVYSKDKQVDSPYNTYKHAGLPPGPIADPGWASIYAALHPAKTKYLYYVAGPGGANEYSATLAGHIHNIRRSRP